MSSATISSTAPLEDSGIALASTGSATTPVDPSSGDPSVHSSLLAHLVEAQITLQELQETIASSNCIVTTGTDGAKSYITFAKEIGDGLIAAAEKACLDYQDAIKKQQEAQAHQKKWRIASLIIGALATVAMAAFAVVSCGASLTLIPALLPVVFSILSMIPVDSDGGTAISMAESKLADKIGTAGALAVLGTAALVLGGGVGGITSLGSGAVAMLRSACCIGIATASQTLLAAGLPQDIAQATDAQWAKILIIVTCSLLLVGITGAGTTLNATLTAAEAGAEAGAAGAQAGAQAAAGGAGGAAGAGADSASTISSLTKALFISQMVTTVGSSGAQAAAAKYLLDQAQPISDAERASALITKLNNQISMNNSTGNATQNNISAILKEINDEFQSIVEGALVGIEPR